LTHPTVDRDDNALGRILGGSADRNVRFNDLRNVLLRLGFNEWVRGSHHIVTHSAVVEIINLPNRESMGWRSHPRSARSVG